MSLSSINTDILLAGAFAAFTVDLLVYPLDTLKTRFQSPDYKRLYVHATNNAVNKKAMFRGLYQGIGSVIIATLPSSGAFFTTYERTKGVLSHSSFVLPQPFIHAAASSLGELVSCAILTPAEVIKQNAQMVQRSSSSNSTNATLQTIARFRNQPLALWRGYTALAGRNLPFTALQFPLFEKMKEGIKSRRRRSGKRTGSVLETGVVTAVSAGTAGAVAAVVTTPVDVVKTRIMLAAGDGPKNSAKNDQRVSSRSANKDGLVDALGKQRNRPSSTSSTRTRNNTSAWRVGRQVFIEEGAKGLWRGGALRAVWTMVGSGLYLGVYESGRIWLAHRRGESIDGDLV